MKAVENVITLIRRHINYSTAVTKLIYSNKLMITQQTNERAG